MIAYLSVKLVSIFFWCLMTGTIFLLLFSVSILIFLFLLSSSLIFFIFLRDSSSYCIILLLHPLLAAFSYFYKASCCKVSNLSFFVILQQVTSFWSQVGISSFLHLAPGVLELLFNLPTYFTVLSLCGLKLEVLF